MSEKAIVRVKFCNNCDHCPEATLVENGSERHVVITDDFGGKIKMTIEEYAIMLQKGKEILGK